MSVIEDLNRFYRILDALAVRVGGARRLGDCENGTGWPDRGVYFFFEPGEFRAPPNQDRLRVVRVGTHAVSSGSRSTLWARLKQHRGDGKPGGPPSGGNHRGSIFRRHIGMALLRAGRFSGESPATWGIGSSASPDVLIPEQPVERLVSEYLGQMPFLWVEADDEPGPRSIRSCIERNSIGLLSRAVVNDPPSAEWLGRYAAAEAIRMSALWNVNYVGDAYDPAFLDVLEKLAMSGKPQSASPVAVVPELNGKELEPRSVSSSAEPGSLEQPVLALVSCTKKKADHPCEAAELYSPSTFFRMAFELAGKLAESTMILSAKYGLVPPNQVLEPYEQSLVGTSRDERRRWATTVHEQLRATAEYQAARTVIWFAGELYRSDLLPMVSQDRKQCEVPMEGLAQGEQLSWLRDQLGRGDDTVPKASATPDDIQQAVARQATPITPQRQAGWLAKAISWLLGGSSSDEVAQPGSPEPTSPIGVNSLSALIPPSLPPEPSHAATARSSTPNAHNFRRQLATLKAEATSHGQSELVITAGELHRMAGGYPGPNHRMPVCCSVMRQEMSAGDRVVSEPPKGAGASLTISYRLCSFPSLD